MRGLVGDMLRLLGPNGYVMPGRVNLESFGLVFEIAPPPLPVGRGLTL